MSEMMSLLPKRTNGIGISPREWRPVNKLHEYTKYALFIIKKVMKIFFTYSHIYYVIVIRSFIELSIRNLIL